MKIVNTEITYIEKNYIVSVDDGEREIKCRVNVFDYTGTESWMINTIVAYDTSKADKERIKRYIIENFKP